MAGRWYYRHGQSEHGPCTLAQLEAKVRSGEVTAQNMVREGESDPWEPAGRTPELKSAFAPVAAKPAPPPRPAPAPPPPKASSHHSGTLPAPKALAKSAAAARSASPPPALAEPPIVSQPIVIAPARTSERTTHKLPSRSSKRTPPLLIVGALGGLAALVAIVAVAAASGMFSSQTPTAAKSPPSKKTAEAADAKTVEKQPVASTENLADAQVKAVATISKWREAGKATGGLKNVVSFEVKRISWQPSGDAQLLVELSITNVSSGKLAHTGWNAPGKHGAWLIDNDNDFIASANGSSLGQSLDPGEKITEVLTFDTGKKNFDELRLVLPFSAVARNGYWGYSIPGSMLRDVPQVAAPTPLAAADKQPMAAAKPAPDVDDIANPPALEIGGGPVDDYDAASAAMDALAPLDKKTPAAPAKDMKKD